MLISNMYDLLSTIKHKRRSKLLFYIQSKCTDFAEWQRVGYTPLGVLSFKLSVQDLSIVEKEEHFSTLVKSNHHNKL